MNDLTWIIFLLVGILITAIVGTGISLGLLRIITHVGSNWKKWWNRIFTW